MFTSAPASSSVRIVASCPHVAASTNAVAPFFPTAELKRRAATLVSADLWALLTTMNEKSERALGGSLKELMPVVERRLKRDGAFQKSEYRMEQVRLGRMAVLK